MKKLIVALLLTGVSVAAHADMTIRRWSPDDGPNTTPQTGGIHPHYNLGVMYAVEVHLKNKSVQYFSGAFQGWALVSGQHRGEKPTGGTIPPKGTVTHPGGNAKVYLVFEGAHSTLFYLNNHDWFTVDGAVKWS